MPLPLKIAGHNTLEDIHTHTMNARTCPSGARLRVMPLPLKIAGRNRAPKPQCTHCSGQATLVCPVCSTHGECWLGKWELSKCFCCAACKQEHKEVCEADLADPEDVLLPVRNSPRMGVCGYEG